MTTKRAPTRKSRGATHVWLLKLVQRLKSDAPLTLGDRQAAALLLSQVADDQDARLHFLETVTHRPDAHDQRAWDAAWIYRHRIKFDGEESGKVLRGDVAKLAGLSDAQVDHAVRKHQHNIDAALEIFGHELSALTAAECITRLHQREK